MHTIAAKAVAFKEALDPSFKSYAKSVIDNAQRLASSLQKRGLKIVSGGTDSHLLLVDLRPANITGKEAQLVLDSVGITGNKNSIPFDPQPFTICSGIRLGTPALTTRGFGLEEMDKVAELITRAIEGRDNQDALAGIKREVRELAARFPLYRYRLAR
jgi:glycine hydroxymethyltransferase